MATCPESQIRVNDKNVRITIVVQEDCTAVDISSATAYEIVFYKPDGTTSTVDASLLTDGTDGSIYYNSLADTFDQCGLWKIQAIIYYGSSSTFHSKIETFRVYSNLV